MDNHFVLIMNKRLKLVKEIFKLNLQNLVPLEYYKIEDEDEQASILKGLIEQSSYFHGLRKEGIKT